MRKRMLLSAAALAALLAVCALLFPAGARADIFYTVSNYATGSMGMIKLVYQFPNEVLILYPNLVNNLGRDAFGYTFTNHENRPFGLIREYHLGPNDRVLLYYTDNIPTPSNFTNPILNTAACNVSNIHAAVSDCASLYVGTYESYDASAPGVENTVEIARIGMADGYTVTGRSKYPAFPRDGKTWYPRQEGLWAIGDKIYALWSISGVGAATYQPS